MVDNGVVRAVRRQYDYETKNSFLDVKLQDKNMCTLLITKRVVQNGWYSSDEIDVVIYM